MFYKVYAQSVDVPQPITMISETDLVKELEPLIDLAVEKDLATKVQAEEIAIASLKEVGIISCGDYCIEECDNVPHEQPVICDFDIEIFEY